MRFPLLGPILVAVTALAQSPVVKPTFEAASIKRSNPNSTERPNICRGGPGTSDPGLLVCTNAALSVLVSKAYDLRFYQLVCPDWVNMGGSANGYDVTARIAPGSTVDQFRLMLQDLLIERFSLAIHREQRDWPHFSLTRGKTAPSLKRSSEPAPPGPLFAQTFVAGHLRYTQHNQPLKRFVDFLGMPLSAPVTDDTGIEGDYDITIEFMPDERYHGFSSLPHVSAEEADAVPTLFRAIQKELGLRLEQQKGTIEVTIVDHADKTPTAN